jgi:hypothetical protein
MRKPRIVGHENAGNNKFMVDVEFSNGLVQTIVVVAGCKNTARNRVQKVLDSHEENSPGQRTAFAALTYPTLIKIKLPLN